MRATQTILFLMLLISFSQVFRSCEIGPYEMKSVMVKVDSIHLPSEIKSTIPFEIEFFGIIGNNGCYHSGGYLQTSSGNDIIIEAYGTFDFQAKNCPAIMVYLNPNRLIMTIPDQGIYNLKIKQPDGTFLVRQINVKS